MHSLRDSFTIAIIQPTVTTLYAATSNPGKLREFATAAAPAGITIQPLPNLATILPPDEDAPNFIGNAEIKAIFYSQLAPDLLVFADDSGIEADALGGRPGVISAHFADSLNFEPDSPLSKDERNNRCLLSLLHDLEIASEGQVSRAARFVCTLALARNGKILLRAEGTVEGDLTDAPRGANGFGYDPLFLLRSRGLTLAELRPEEKWTISHRGNAFRDLLQQLANSSF